MRWGRRKKQCALVVITSVIVIVAVIRIIRNGKKEHHNTSQDGIPHTMQNISSARFLNVAIWEEICGQEMRSLKEFPLFPHGPSKRLRTSSLRLQFTREFEDFGLRIFGFLSPVEAGTYTFYLASSGTSELWISSDSSQRESKLVGNSTAGLSGEFSHHIDTLPMLAGNRYYIEILHKQGPQEQEKLNFIHVMWRSSSWTENEPRDISADVLIPFEMEWTDSGHVHALHPSLYVSLPFHPKRGDLSFANEKIKSRAQMYLLPFISESVSKNLFPPCHYSPSYLVKRPLKRYESIYEMHYTSVYPFDYTDVVEHKPAEEGDFVHFGNDELDANTVKKVVTEVWEQIQKKYPGKYSLNQIINVEENHDEGTGDRFLVELEIQEISSGKHERFSEYLYRQWGAKSLCSPVGVAWNKSAMINILLTTGNNQGGWILHFLDNMENIYNRTKDSNFNVIITDFDSSDLDFEKALKKAAIPNYQYANIKDKFSRALGLQRAAEMVKDHNSILFAMDLHLDMPYHFLDDVRKHCVQSKIAYSPFVIRLACGATPKHPFGFWEVSGLGLMGMYKSDWDRVGGMNTVEYKNRWGGEDWEMSDRILEAGMEIEILKMMHFFHYFHSRKGMWTDSKASSHVDMSHKYWH